jgi:hypothetical protein
MLHLRQNSDSTYFIHIHCAVSFHICSLHVNVIRVNKTYLSILLRWLIV